MFAADRYGKNGDMPDSNPTENRPPKDEPFDAPDAEDQADREFGLEEDSDFS